MWLLEMLAHWTPQLSGLLVVAALAACALRRWKPATWLCGFAALGIAAQVTALRPHAAAITPGTANLTLFYANVMRTNADPAQLLPQIEDTDADLVFLVEVDDAWLRTLDALPHPPLVQVPLDNNFGVALYSRVGGRATAIPLDEQMGMDAPAVVAEVAGLSFIGVHAVPPASGDWAQLRDQQMLAVANRVAQTDGPVVVAGDFNTTWRAPGFAEFVRVSGLGWVRPPGRLAGTWPAGFPSVARIGIDHVFVSDDVTVRDLRIGELFGSDHLPLIVDLDLQSM